jgi:hypothetical protein
VPPATGLQHLDTTLWLEKASPLPHFPHLKRLTIGGFKDGGIAQLAAATPRLEQLHVSSE